MSQMSRLIFLILQITDACSADGRCQPLREEPVVGGCGFVARGESLFFKSGVLYSMDYTEDGMKWLKDELCSFHFHKTGRSLDSPPIRMKKHLNLRQNVEVLTNTTK